MNPTLVKDLCDTGVVLEGQYDQVIFSNCRNLNVVCRDATFTEHQRDYFSSVVINTDCNGILLDSLTMSPCQDKIKRYGIVNNGKNTTIAKAEIKGHYIGLLGNKLGTGMQVVDSRFLCNMDDVRLLGDKSSVRFSYFDGLYEFDDGSHPDHIQLYTENMSTSIDFSISDCYFCGNKQGIIVSDGCANGEIKHCTFNNKHAIGIFVNMTTRLHLKDLVSLNDLNEIRIGSSKHILIPYGVRKENVKFNRDVLIRGDRTWYKI